MTLNDPEPPKYGVLVNYSRFRAATSISRVNCTKMAGDRPRQPAYEIFSIRGLNVDFSSPSLNPLRSRRIAQAGIKEGYPSKKWLFVRCWLV